MGRKRGRRSSNLSHVLVSAREVAIGSVVAVGGGVVGRHLASAVLSILPELVVRAVHPLVEEEHVRRGLQESVAGH